MYQNVRHVHCPDFRARHNSNRAPSLSQIVALFNSTGEFEAAHSQPCIVSLLHDVLVGGMKPALPQLPHTKLPILRKRSNIHNLGPVLYSCAHIADAHIDKNKCCSILTIDAPSSNLPSPPTSPSPCPPQPSPPSKSGAPQVPTPQKSS